MLGALPLPIEPDPYEVAYLRGGEIGILRRIVLELLRAGYLQQVGEGQQLQKSVASDTGNLSSSEIAVFTQFEIPNSAGEPILLRPLPSEIVDECATYSKRLLHQQLILPPGARRLDHLMFVIAALPIVGLGGFRISTS